MDAPASMEFLRRIKAELPETVFHGTDVGHQYGTTGARFLAHLRERGLEHSETYLLALENIEQGRAFYGELNRNHSMRADMMATNFIRIFDGLGGESVMGALYGASHVAFGRNPWRGGGETMATQLRARYGDSLSATMLWDIVTGVPCAVDVGGAEFEATFFGDQTMNWHAVYARREFWRLDGAYERFRDRPLTRSILPFDNFPMAVEVGQVFAIRYVRRADGGSRTGFYRSSGMVWNGRDAAQVFEP